MKQYDLPAARIEEHFGLKLLIAEIPWEHFCATGGPDAYASQIAGGGYATVIVAKAPDGKWGSATLVDGAFRKLIEATPIESLPWHKLSVEAERYPWESFHI